MKDWITGKIKKIEGSSLVFMIMMITVISIIGGTLMTVTIVYYKLNLAYKASEDLYYMTDKEAQTIHQKIAESITNILKDKVKVYNDTNDGIDNTILQNIIRIYGKKDDTDTTALLQDYLQSDASEPAKVAELNAKLLPAIQGLQGEMVAKALYDIAFKLMVYTGDTSDDNDILRRDLTNDSLKQILENNGITDDIASIKTFKKISIEKKDSNIPQKEGQWIAGVIDGNVEDYDEYIKSNPYYSFRYEIQNGNDKANLKKKMSITFQVASQGFGNDVIDTSSAATAKSFTNPILSKALATAGDLKLSNTGDVNIKGDVYAYGHMPDDFANIIIPESDFDGVIINGTNNPNDGTVRKVNIDGNLFTRAYLKFMGNNIKFSTTEDVICDTLFVDNYNFTTATNLRLELGIAKGDPNINIDNDLYTFNDILVDGTKAFVNIGHNYCGLAEGNSSIGNRSSAIFLCNPTSRIKVTNQALIGGVAFVSNIKYDNLYPFKLGESIAIGDAYKVYQHQLMEDEPTDFNEWYIDGMISIQKTLTKITNNEPDYELDKTQLLKHFYYYIIYRNGDADLGITADSITYDTDTQNGEDGGGVELNGAAENYAPGIINANGTSYWPRLYESELPGTSAAFSDPSKTLLQCSDVYYDQYKDDKKDYIDHNVNFLKEFDEVYAANPASYPDKIYKIDDDAVNKEAEYTDNQGVLFSPSGALPVDPVYTDYYCYLSNNQADNIIIGDDSDKTIDASDINDKYGIIYTKGTVEIKPTEDWTFKGTIIALGGITIDSSNSVTINFGDTVKTAVMDFYNNASVASDIRKFFASGNVQVTQSTNNAYRALEQNVRIVDKKLEKNY